MASNIEGVGDSGYPLEPDPGQRAPSEEKGSMSGRKISPKPKTKATFDKIEDSSLHLDDAQTGRRDLEKTISKEIPEDVETTAEKIEDASLESLIQEAPITVLAEDKREIETKNESFAKRKQFGLKDFTLDELKRLKEKNRKIFPSRLATDKTQDALFQIKPGGLAKTGAPFRRKEDLVEGLPDQAAPKGPTLPQNYIETIPGLSGSPKSGAEEEPYRLPKDKENIQIGEIGREEPIGEAAPPACPVPVLNIDFQEEAALKIGALARRLGRITDQAKEEIGAEFANKLQIAARCLENAQKEILKGNPDSAIEQLKEAKAKVQACIDQESAENIGKQLATFQSLLDEINSEIQENLAIAWLQMSAPAVLDEEMLLDLDFLIHPESIPFQNKFSRFDQGTVVFAKEPGVSWKRAFQSCREEINEQKDSFKALIQSEEDKTAKNPSDPRNRLYRMASQIKTTREATANHLEIKESSGGCGGAHFCKTAEDQPRLVSVLKSVNGDVGTLDNSKNYIHPITSESLVKPTCNYESVQKEALAYEISLEIGCEGVVPPTILAVINHGFISFFDNPSVKKTLDRCPENVREGIVSHLGGPASRERLCSLQEAIQNPILMNDLILNWGKEGYPPLEFNHESFEKAIHLTRILGETDGHSDNYLTIVKEGEYHIVKIDSGFSFPLSNKSALNSLTSLPNAKQPISEGYREIVLNTDPVAIEQLAHKYRLDQREIQSAFERIEFMKELVTLYPEITHREFELRLRLFSGEGYEEELSHI